MYERACALSDLSSSPDLALTLMSARMRGARVRALIHESQRFRSKADGLYLMTPASDLCAAVGCQQFCKESRKRPR